MQSALVGIDQSEAGRTKHSTSQLLSSVAEEAATEAGQDTQGTLRKPSTAESPGTRRLRTGEKTRGSERSTDLLMPDVSSPSRRTRLSRSRGSDGRPASTGGVAPVSDLVASVMNDFDEMVQFDDASVERLLERPATSQSVFSNQSAESVRRDLCWPTLPRSAHGLPRCDSWPDLPFAANRCCRATSRRRPR